MRFLITFALVGMSFANGASANGFFLPQQSTTQQGRAFAGNAALPEDVSVIFANPAAITFLPTAQFQFDAAVIASDLNLKDTGSSASSPGSLGSQVPLGGSDGGNPGGLSVLPTIFAAAPLSADGRLWGGIAVSAPFGQSLDYGDWFGRYDAVEARLLTFDIAPAIAYKITPKLSIGAGINIQYAKAKLTNALPDPFAAGGPSLATDGLGKLDGDSLAVGYNIGIYATPTPKLSLGLHYRSAMDHDLDGDLDFSGFTGPASILNAKFDTTTKINLPDVATVSMAYDVRPDLTLATSFQWFGWSRFESITIDVGSAGAPIVRPQNYRDSGMLSIGAIWRANDKWTFRGGVQFDRTPTTDEFRNTSPPDANRIWLSFGGTRKLSDRLSLSFGITHVEFESTSFDTTTQFYGGTPLATSVNTRGEVKSRVTTLGMGLTWHY